MNPLLLLLFGFGAVAVLASKPLGKRAAATPAPKQKVGVSLPGSGTQFATRPWLQPVVNASALSQIQINPVTTKVLSTSDPYTLAPALAMVRTITSWCSLATNGNDVVNVVKAKLTEILSSNLAEHEKVRALVLGIALPLLGSEITLDNDPGPKHGMPMPLPLTFRFMNQPAIGGSTANQQAQLAHAIIWVGYYLLSPKTACVLKGCDLLADDSSLPGAHAITVLADEFVTTGYSLADIASGTASRAHQLTVYATLFPSGAIAPVSIDVWRDSSWNLSPSPDDRSRAIMDVYRRVTYQIRKWWDPTDPDPSRDDKCYYFDPNPCDQLTQWDQQMWAFVLDANLLSGEHPPVPQLRKGNTVNSVEGMCEKMLQHASRVILYMQQPHADVPIKEHDVFAIIATAIATALSIVATAFTAGAASGLLAASVASVGTLVASAISVAVGLVKAAVDGSAVEAVHAAVGSGLAQSLVANAGLLMPQDLQDAAKAIEGFAPQVKKGIKDIGAVASGSPQSGGAIINDLFSISSNLPN